MTKDEFEKLLVRLCAELTSRVQKDPSLKEPKKFENEVRSALQELVGTKLRVDLTPHPHVFPDIVVGEFGIEVKVVAKNNWRSVANSIFEGTRDENVKHVYVLFGKMGGLAAVDWGSYEDCVIHVRTSHVPRFEVEIGTTESLFTKFGITYEEFRNLETDDKMQFVRAYARSRMNEGDRLWWLEDKPEESQEHSLPLAVRLYMGLNQDEKRRLRAEAAILCSQVVKPSRSKKKYDDAALYLITYHGVLCSQARDLFSAGSVALRSDSTRGGNYILRALADIEREMRDAALRLEDGLFVEYWGKSVPPAKRLREWLRRADGYASGWKPSKALFRNRR